MGKCSGLGCSVYDYLGMLVETDIADAEKARETQEKRKREISETIRKIEERLKASEKANEPSPMRE